MSLLKEQIIGFTKKESIPSKFKSIVVSSNQSP